MHIKSWIQTLKMMENKSSSQALNDRITMTTRFHPHGKVPVNNVIFSEFFFWLWSRFSTRRSARRASKLWENERCSFLGSGRTFSSRIGHILRCAQYVPFLFFFEFCQLGLTGDGCWDATAQHIRTKFSIQPQNTSRIRFHLKNLPKNASQQGRTVFCVEHFSNWKFVFCLIFSLCEQFTPRKEA